jgi:hypothetical protein
LFRGISRDLLLKTHPSYHFNHLKGANYTVNDFVRLQLYRDISVYEEVGRRAKIVCSDMDATIGNFLSVNQWAASAAATARRRAQGYVDNEDRIRHLIEVIPDLTDSQLEYVAASHLGQDKLTLQYSSCAPEYTTTCFFQKVGTRFHDN